MQPRRTHPNAIIQQPPEKNDVANFQINFNLPRELKQNSHKQRRNNNLDLESRTCSKIFE